MCHPPVRFEDIEKTPAIRLLQLSHKELDKLIEQADYALEKAQHQANWLRGIKLEKTVREDMPLQEDKNGGAQ